MTLTNTTYPLAGIHAEHIIGVIETRRGSYATMDGGVVAYREPGVDGDYAYVVHNYAINVDGQVSLAVGDYRLSRAEAMQRLLERAASQGQGMYDPTLG